jgi:hypothetical protein
MHTMEEEINMFASLGWEKDIRSLGDPDVPFIPSSERDIRVGNQCRRSRNDTQKMKRGERICR